MVETSGWLTSWNSAANSWVMLCRSMMIVSLMACVSVSFLGRPLPLSHSVTACARRTSSANCAGLSPAVRWVDNGPSET